MTKSSVRENRKLQVEKILPLPHFWSQCFWRTLLPLALGLWVGVWGEVVGAKPIAYLLPEKGRIEIETRGDLHARTQSIPFYEENGIRYFSAGVGLQEREAEYPPFPLKCVFVVGDHPYLARVGVTIQDQKGAVVLDVPADRVNGPWLFVDLPKGRYTVTATRADGTRVQRTVTVGEKATRIVYFRWSKL